MSKVYKVIIKDEVSGQEKFVTDFTFNTSEFYTIDTNVRVAIHSVSSYVVSDDLSLAIEIEVEPLAKAVAYKCGGEVITSEDKNNA